MLYLLLYFLIPTFAVCWFLYLNAQKKWFTRQDADYLDFEQIAVAIAAFLFWPITLVVFGFLSAARFLKNNVLPKD